MSSSLLEHMLELRSVLLKCCACICTFFIALVYFANDIYAFIAAPLRDSLPDSMHMIAIDLASPVLAPFKLTFFVAFLLSMPFFLYQVWRFIMPGLYPHEKNLLRLLLCLSTLLFYLGMAFSYSFVLPVIVDFMLQVIPEDVHLSTDIQNYLTFVCKFLIGFGLAFEMPVFVCGLCWVGITCVEQLKLKRPYVIVVAFTCAMFLTPPDVISQCLLAIPMLLLFEVGLLLATLFKPLASDQVNENCDAQ